MNLLLNGQAHSGTIDEDFHCIMIMKCQFGRP